MTYIGSRSLPSRSGEDDLKVETNFLSDMPRTADTGSDVSASGEGVVMFLGSGDLAGDRGVDLPRESAGDPFVGDAAEEFS